MFREVIRQGEEFLAKHPKTPHRLQVLFALAQAYETWWSLSQAAACKPGQMSGCDGYSDPANYIEGSGSARDRAINLYEEVLRLDPDSPEAAYVQWMLSRLKLGIDTNQRRFRCIYD